MVVGGSPTMIGAPAICAGAALRSGAGLVKLAMPTDLLPFALVIEPSATGIALPTSAGPSARATERLDATTAAIHAADPEATAVLAVGPGMGSGGVRPLVMRLLGGKRVMVLDADGLNALAHSGRQLSDDHSSLILTPHPGEFARLAKPLGIPQSPTDPDTRPEAAARLAEAHRAIVVLKGRRTVVSDGKRVFTNGTGNSALATAGSGDVLTGITASLLAQNMAPFDAACLAVHVHGLAADRWAKRHGNAGLKACDLADELPDAFAALRG